MIHQKSFESALYDFGDKVISQDYIGFPMEAFKEAYIMIKTDDASELVAA